ncbi:MAG TPA: alpha/beta fold hydrolase [Candidatus Cybelea sp.]|nr:alpha/beta fold hydrolase [Candidatus Cybelea sp.]
MSASDPSEIDAEAEDLIEAMTVPARRVRPRLAEPLRDAQEFDVETPFGPVKAWRLGRGKATLLVHGWDDDNSLWSPLLQKFAAVGRPAVALDLPGHGFSRAENPSPRSATAAVLAVAQAAGPVDSIAGHSYGCGIAMRAMTAGLAVERAVLMASAIPRAERRFARAKRGGVPQAVIDRAAELMAARADPADAPFDMEAAAATMTAPALFVHSMDDEQCPVEDAETLRKLWPNSKIALADGLGHRLIAQDSLMLDRVVAFLDGAR